jgi:protein TonB
VQGTVKLSLIIDPRGEVISAMITSQPGYAMGDEAIKAAKQMKFSPATKAGKPVSFWIRLDVSFRMR